MKIRASGRWHLRFSATQVWATDFIFLSDFFFPKVIPESLLPSAESPCSASLKVGKKEDYICYLWCGGKNTQCSVCSQSCTKKGNNENHHHHSPWATGVWEEDPIELGQCNVVGVVTIREAVEIEKETKGRIFFIEKSQEMIRKFSQSSSKSTENPLKH